MNGIIVVDKPAGFTSFDVVAKLRGICGVRKIGHAGTLDPMATGVLPVFVGPAVKAVDLQPNQTKTYEATFLFGQKTDTGDVTGAVVERADGVVGKAELESVLPQFLGAQQQLPPLYSAVKVAGKPLYKYAREGKHVERKLRAVEIHSIEYVAHEGENLHKLRVHCSKGTYIRTLAEDVGLALGMPATLAALRRTVAGIFTVQDAHCFDEIQLAKDRGELCSLFTPLGRVFEQEAAVELGEEALVRLCGGAVVYGRSEAAGRYAARLEGEFVGLVRVDEEGQMKGEKLFFRPEAML